MVGSMVVVVWVTTYKGEPVRRDYSEFTRLFRELTEGKKARDIAQRIDVTPAYVYQMRSGAYCPGRALLERIVHAFRLDREQWFAAAGQELYYWEPSGQAEPPDTPPIGGRLTAEDTEEPSPTLLQRALGAAERSAASDYFTRGLRGLQKQFGGNHIVLGPEDVPARDATLDDVEELLARLAERMQKARDERRGKGGSRRVRAAALVAGAVPLIVDAAQGVLSATGS